MVEPRTAREEEGKTELPKFNFQPFGELRAGFSTSNGRRGMSGSSVLRVVLTGRGDGRATL
jgi:hypothetical protein